MYCRCANWCFLSGGLDSTSVVKESKSFIKDIKTFSIGNTEEKYDESRWINQAIEKLGVDNFLKVLDSKVSKEIIYNAIDSFEEPFSDISIIPTYIISDYMSNYSKVALSGDGGDELLGGYSRYAWSSYSSLIPNLISSPLTFLFRQKEYSKLFQLSQLLENSASKRYSSFFVDTNLVNNKNFKQFNFQKKYWKEIKGDLIKSMQLADYKFYLPEVMMVKIDQTSMSNSLEVRSPFLDHKLIEYVLSTKSSGYTSYKNQKIALKKYLSGSFNSEFLNRKKKGFSIPINSILKTLESDLQNVIPFTNEIFGTYINEKDLTNCNSFELSRIWKLFILRRWIEANG